LKGFQEKKFKEGKKGVSEKMEKTLEEEASKKTRVKEEG